jgi:PAS domain-containing protein
MEDDPEGLGAMSNNDTKTDDETPSTSRRRFPPAGGLSPVQLIALTALAIFVGEAMIMFVLPLFGDIPVAYEAIIDAVLLTVLTAPVLAFLLFRPMVLHIEERKKAEHALRSLNDDLEQQVASRTEELARSNKVLQREVRERELTEEQLQRTNSFVQRLIELAPSLMATINVDTLKCNYVNGRIEDFLGFPPEAVAATDGGILQLIASDPEGQKCRSMIRDLTIAPHGEIARGRCELKHAEGTIEEFSVAFVVASRTVIGEAEEVLFVATPLNDPA